MADGLDRWGEGRYRLDPLPLVDYERWLSANSKRVRPRTPFHRPDWIRTTGRAFGAHVRCIGIFEGGQLAGAIPGFTKRYGPLLSFGSPLRGMMTPYLGPVFLEEAYRSDSVALSVAASLGFARRRFAISHFRVTTREAADPSGPHLSGMMIEEPETYRLDLSTGIDNVWSNLRPRARRHIRAAERLGIDIVPLDAPELHHRSLADTMDRHGSRITYPPKVFRTLLGELPPETLWRWAARYRGEMIATGMFVHDDTEMFYLAGGSLTRFRQLPMGYLLQWHAIRTAIEHNLSEYDFGGRGIRGVDEFKEAFAPRPTRYWSTAWAPLYVQAARRVLRLARTS